MSRPGRAQCGGRLGRRGRLRRRGPITALILGTAVVALLSPAPRAQSLEERVVQVSLDNGMRFLIVRRGTAPVFSANLRFRVGGVDDRSGASGLAHLFEHMAFKGTSVIGTRDAGKEAEILDALDRVARDLQQELDRGDAADPARLDALRSEMKSLTDRHQALAVKDEFSEIYNGNGAVGLNASTSADLTSYIVSLPSNRLELWCLLESARLRDPVLREFYSERDVVMEERRARIDNQPDGRLYEQLLLTAFQAHPYRAPGVGWLSDLRHLTRPEAEEFRQAYYVPNNSVAALVGDVDPSTAEPLLRRYFGGLRSGPSPPAPVTVEPPQIGERRVEVAFDAEPQLMIAFHKPNTPHPDDAVMDVIDALLASGRTSRLFRSLVVEQRVASNVFTFEAPGDRFPNLFIIAGEPRAPHTTGELERAILSELERLTEEKVAESELQKIRNQVEAGAIYALRSNRGLASQLSYYEILTGDWRDMIRTQEAVKAVTSRRVQEVARRVFVRRNRTVATLARAVKTDDQPPQSTAADDTPGGAS